jgi:glyoxylate reductase
VQQPRHRCRILITQPIHASALRNLEAAGHDVLDLASPRPLAASDIAQNLGACAALICQLTDRVDEQVLSRPSLRAVATVSAGMDHIDLDAARRHGVQIVNTPDVLTEATADFTIALLLAVARRIPESDSLIRAGRFDGWKLIDPLMGADVTGATLGIVGMGRIGQAVARRAHAAFNMPILYHSARDKPEIADLDARNVPLPELLSRADFVSLHAPLSPRTRHLIDADALALMRPTAYLINTARGGLIDEEALVDALAAGELAGAALDVFEHEPQVHPDLVHRTRRVVLAAHAASATTRTRERMSLLAVDALLAALGQLPLPGNASARKGGGA